jgi:hypothetical protein
VAYIGNTNTTQAFTPAVDFFSGNGSTTAFTLSRPVASVAQVQVAIENVPQNPGSAFTVSGNTITFTSAPPSGTNNIYVYYTSPITQVIAPSDGTVGTSALASNSVTQAKLATGVAGTGPAFSAYQSSAQTVSNATFTKINFQTEEFDTNNNFASSTFTPTIAGYYQVSGGLYFGTSSGFVLLVVYKTGVAYKRLAGTASPNNGTATYGSCIVYCNGSTDTIELYAYQNSGGSVTMPFPQADLVYFQAALVRAA